MYSRHTQTAHLPPTRQVHLQEEAILARATGFAADETLRLPPRHPGQGLHQSLIDVARAQERQDRRAARKIARQKAKEEQAAAEAAAAEADAGANSTEGAANASGSRPGTSPSTVTGQKGATTAREEGADGSGAGAAVSRERSPEDGGLLSDDDDEDHGEDGADDSDAAAAAAAAAYGNESWLEPLLLYRSRTVGGRGVATGTAGSERVNGVRAVVPEWDRVPTSREQGLQHDVVVTGPPMSGKSTLSHALAEKYQIPRLSVDSVITEALRLRSALGARVRVALHWFTAREEVMRTWFLTRQSAPIFGECFVVGAVGVRRG